MNQIIDFETFARAIAHEMDVSMSAAEQTALTVLNFFGYSSTALGNHLLQKERDLFYILEDAGFMRGHSDTYCLFTGADWRTFTWTLNTEKILESAVAGCKEHHALERTIYDKLPEEAWARG